MDSTIRKTSLTTAALFVAALLIFLLGLSEEATSVLYSNGIYPYLSITLRFLSSIFPFAIGDILYIALVILGIYRLVLLFLKAKKRQLNKTHRILVPFQMIKILLVLFISFKLLWGLNYSRPGIAKQLSITDQKYSVEQLVALGNYFIDKLNALQPKTNTQLQYSVQDLELKATAAYQKAAQKNGFFAYTQPSVKPVLNAWLISKMGIEGYYNPLSGEANINMKLPPWVLPFVTCHEISHQLGVAKEDEANLVAYLVGINSDDLDFQYSVNYNMLRYILLEIRLKSPDDYLVIRNRISPALLANFKAENEFWKQYNGQMSGYMGIAFDKFLKLNHQKRGIKSYQNIVIWLWNYHKVELASTIGR